MPTPTKPGAPYRLTYEAGARPRSPAKDAPRKQEAPEASAATSAVPSISHKSITRVILAVAGLTIVTSLLLGNWMTAAAVSIVCLTMLQGLWRGAAEVFGVVVAMVIAVLLAPPVGRAFEGITHSLAGTGGIANRLLSMSIVAMLITIALAGVIGALARKWLKKRPAWNAANKYVGAALGLVEGTLIAFLLFWSLLMLEPIAQSQLASAEPNTNPVAQRVIAAADVARASSFSGIAQATNPLPDMDIVALIGDFAAITSHPEARDHLLNSEPIQRIQKLPSLQAALDEVKNDPALANLVNAQGLTTDDVNTFLNSPTILRIIDRGDAMRELKPLAAELKAAIREAKGKIEAEGPK